MPNGRLETSPRQAGRARDSGRVLIISCSNLSVPFDRRVWLECRSLAEAGFQGGRSLPQRLRAIPAYATLSGVELSSTNRMLPAAHGLPSSSNTLLLLRHPRAQPQGEPAGSLHHCPKLQSAGPLLAHRTPVPAASRVLLSSSTTTISALSCTNRDSRTAVRVIYQALRLMERCTMRTADHVISTNDSYQTDRHGARRRRRVQRHCGPHRPATTARMHRDRRLIQACDEAGLISAAYIGVMGPQDGVDLVFELADLVVRQLGRRDISFHADRSGRLLRRSRRSAQIVSISRSGSRSPGAFPMQRSPPSFRPQTWGSRRIPRTR